MNDVELDAIWLALYNSKYVLMPFSSGDWMVYHKDNLLFGHNYEIIRPTKFRLKLFYENSLLSISTDNMYPINEINLIDIEMLIKLEDFFEIKRWRGRDMPIDLKKDEIQNIVNRLLKLSVFS